MKKQKPDSRHIPLNGCVVTGKTKAEVEKNIHEAIEFHLQGLREEGMKLPQPQSYSKYIEIAA